MLARDVAINVIRKDDKTRVRILIRPKLQVATKPGDSAPLPHLREVVCTLNDDKFAVLTVGDNFNDSGFFEVELHGGQPGNTINVAWTDVAGNKGQGSSVLK
jgi:hypothetical protein